MYRYQAFVILLTLLTPKAYSLIVEPMVLEMTTHTQAGIVVTNSSTVPVAVTAELNKILITDGTVQRLQSEGIDNHEMYNSTLDNILVFPPAFILEAGKKQHVRLIWQGTEPLLQSQAYYLRFETPNIKMTESAGGSALAIQLSYSALIHLSDQSLYPAVELEKTQLINNALEISLSNFGQRYAYLSDYMINLGQWSLQSTLASLYPNDVYLPPNSESTLRIPFHSLPTSDLTQTVSIQKRKGM